MCRHVCFGVTHCCASIMCQCASMMLPADLCINYVSHTSHLAHAGSDHVDLLARTGRAQKCSKYDYPNSDIHAAEDLKPTADTLLTACPSAAIPATAQRSGPCRVDSQRFDSQRVQRETDSEDTDQLPAAQQSSAAIPAAGSQACAYRVDSQHALRKSDSGDADHLPAAQQSSVPEAAVPEKAGPPSVFPLLRCPPLAFAQQV